MTPGHLRLPIVVLLTVIAVSPVNADDTASVTIERVQWGFDGRGRERSFVPLSVLVRNNTPLEFEGTLSLTKLAQQTKPIDASVTREIYIGPLTSRWVQFVPYMIGDWEQWRLTWGHAADEKFEIATPQLGERATVLLYDPDDLQFAGGVLRRFPMDLFPASVTATDALRGVAMDKSPRWQGARRQAFLDWLRLGGRVYLLQDDEGRFPRFPASLDVLNGQGNRFQVGSGTVVRVNRSVQQLDAEFVRREILTDHAPGLSERQDQTNRGLRNSPRRREAGPALSRTGWDRDTQLFLDLQSIARFARRWWVIYVLALMYLFALFPVCYRVGREARDYRWVYAVLLVTVGLFSYAFASLSKLGAAEVSRARSVAVARQISEGVYDVTQWTCIGVRTAGDYSVQHGGTGRLYTTSQDIERIDGEIFAGTSARIDLQIPPASTRSVLHRARANAAPLGLNLRQIAFDERGLDVLTLDVGPEFPSDSMFLLAVHQGQMYELQRRADQLMLSATSRTSMVSFLTDYFEAVRTISFRATPNTPDEEALDDDVYRISLRTLVGNSFGFGEYLDLTRLQIADGMMRIFVYAPLPASLQIEGEVFPDQEGYVLYVVDIPTRRDLLSPRELPATGEE